MYIPAKRVIDIYYNVSNDIISYYISKQIKHSENKSWTKINVFIEKHENLIELNTFYFTQPNKCGRE